MNVQQLIDTTNTMVADDKGLLAMDESNPTCNKRFAKLGIPQTVDARRAYRELIVTTPGLGECISGVIRHGWLILYHGVSKMPEPNNEGRQLCYSAGVMVLSKEHPRVIRYRSVDPVLTPPLPQERDGTISNVVFPTGIDRRDDLGLPDRIDVYYGMADDGEALLQKRNNR